ncbi:MAG: hypothetical protein ACKVGZ_18415 [Alphaproteobacteria bacterium]|jgi:hypothetical protein
MYQTITGTPSSPRFRHFFDQNALSLWMMGVAVLAALMALPALI